MTKHAFGISEGVFFLFLGAAGATTAAVAAGAGAAVGTADTFFAAFLGLINIPAGNSQDRNHQDNNDNIYRFHSLLLSAERVLSLQFFIGTDAQPDNNGSHDEHSHETGQEACAQRAGDD